MRSIVVVLILWVSALIGFRLTFHDVPMEAVHPYIDLTNLFAVIAAAVIAYNQLRLLNKQLRSEYLKNRRDHALSYSLPKNDRILEGLQAIDKKYPPAEWDDKPIALSKIIDSTTRKRLSEDVALNEIERLLAHWENLALTIGAGTTDEAMAFEMGGELFVAYVRRFELFVAWYRERNPRAYEHLCDLAKRWREQIAREKHNR